MIGRTQCDLSGNELRSAAVSHMDGCTGEQMPGGDRRLAGFVICADNRNTSGP